ncbi:MAG TPA: phosphoribosyltransferase [Kofleriaceae bacterium]|nr:phosphoribosyltransferase [Kofleriaceae bacterium]
MPDVRRMVPGLLGIRPRIFADRRSAGRMLGEALMHHRGANPIVLGLPRGGVPVADEVARALGGTLDVWVVRKLGVPYQPELGMGAIAEGPAVVLERSIVEGAGVSRKELFEIAHREMDEVGRRVERFRSGRALPELRDRVVILVDDGIATGGTMRAAIRAIKKRRPERLIVATPVASPDVVQSLAREVDEVVCLYQPRPMYAIGLWYEDFEQTADEEVVRILARASYA